MHKLNRDRNSSSKKGRVHNGRATNDHFTTLPESKSTISFIPLKSKYDFFFFFFLGGGGI